jgi:hypothetical protein
VIVDQVLKLLVCFVCHIHRFTFALRFLNCRGWCKVTLWWLAFYAVQLT